MRSLCVALCLVGCATPEPQAVPTISGYADPAVMQEWLRVATLAQSMPGFVGTHRNGDGNFVITLHGSADAWIAELTDEPTVTAQDAPFPPEIYQRTFEQLTAVLDGSGEGYGLSLDMERLVWVIGSIENGNGDQTTCRTYPVTTLGKGFAPVIDERDC